MANYYFIDQFEERFDALIENPSNADTFIQKTLDPLYKCDSLTEILTRSILSGEIYYIFGTPPESGLKDYFKYFMGLKDQLKATFVNFSGEDSTKIKSTIEQYYVIIEHFSQYLSMIKDSIEDMLTSKNIFNHSVIDSKISLHDILFADRQKESDIFLTFLISLKLSEYDESLEASEDQAIELNRFLSILRPLQGRNETIRLAKELCEYLIYKINVRERNVYTKGIRKNDSINPIIDSLNLDGYEQNLSEPTSSVVKNLKERTSFHYRDEQDTAIISNAEKQIKKYLEIEKYDSAENESIDISSQIRLCHFHSLNKRISLRLRKIEKSKKIIIGLAYEENELSTWIDLLQRQFTHVKNEIDKLAFTSVITLLINNRLRIILVREKLENRFGNIIEDLSSDNEKDWLQTLDTYRKTHLDIDTVLKSGIHDYHGYKYFLDFLDSLFSHIRENSLCLFSDIDSITEKEVNKINEINDRKFNKLKDLYSELLHIYDLKLKMYSVRKHKPVYLTFMECVGDLNGDKTIEQIIHQKNNDLVPPYHKYKIANPQLFIDSAYVLPEDFSIAKDDLRGKETYLTSNIRSLKNRVEIDVKNKVFEKKADEFEKKIKENEFKVIQIVALFVTVSVFVLNSVKFFTETNDLYGYLSLLSGLAACLVLFNAIFKWLVAWGIHKAVLPKNSVIDSILKMIIDHKTVQSLGTIMALIVLVILVFFSFMGNQVFEIFEKMFRGLDPIQYIAFVLLIGSIFIFLSYYGKSKDESNESDTKQFYGGLYDIYEKFIRPNLIRIEALVIRVFATILDPLMIFIVFFSMLAYYSSVKHYENKKSFREKTIENRLDSLIKARK